MRRTKYFELSRVSLAILESMGEPKKYKRVDNNLEELLETWEIYKELHLLGELSSHAKIRKIRRVFVHNFAYGNFKILQDKTGTYFFINYCNLNRIFEFIYRKKTANYNK